MEPSPAPVLLLGGYGKLGSRIARSLRRLHPDLPMVIAGRDSNKATELAASLGSAEGASIDLNREDLGLGELKASIVVTALRDLTLNSQRFAATQRIPYIALSDGAFELGPTVAMAARGSSAVLTLGHSLGGVPVMTAFKLASQFSVVREISIGLVLDPADSLGAASAADMERIEKVGPPPLLLAGGRWEWVAGSRATRSFVGPGGAMHQGSAVGLIDVLSLAGSGADYARVDIAQAATESSRRGGSPSVEVVVEIAGTDRVGADRVSRVEIVDGEGYATMSAKGVALAVDRMLGLDGSEAPAPGLHFPESLFRVDHYSDRMKALGLAMASQGERATRTISAATSRD